MARAVNQALLAMMKRHTNSQRSLRTITERELAVATGGYEIGVVDTSRASKLLDVINGIGGSGLVIPGLT